MRNSVVAVSIVCAALAAGAAARAQGLLAKPGVQHATVATTSSSTSAAPGSTVTLYADVTPNPSIHIYAEGAKDFTPVSVVLTPNAAVSAGKAKYPKPDAASAPGATDAVPAYKQPFRIAVPLTINSSSKPGDVLSVAGAVNYQACDDRLCYPVTAAPVTWTIAVK
jgi:hypothetical protein